MARPRRARRAGERELAKLLDQAVRLFAAQPGGTPERPLFVDSAGLVEPHARSVRCPRCETRLTVREHAAVVRDGVRLREVRVRCDACRYETSLWFRLGRAALN